MIVFPIFAIDHLKEILKECGQIPHKIINAGLATVVMIVYGVATERRGHIFQFDPEGILRLALWSGA